MNDEHLSRWHSLVAELQPLVASASSSGANPNEGNFSLAPLHVHLGYSPYLVLIAALLFALAVRIPSTLRWLLGIVAAMIAALSILQLRWIDHYATFVLPVIAVGLFESIGRAAKASARIKLSPRAQAAIVFIILGASSIPYMTWPRLALLARANAAATADPKLTKPETQALLRALGPRQDQIRTDFVARAINLQESKSLFPAVRHNILCEEGEGPTLLYETGLPVVAAPYHRAIGGIVAMMEFFAERDPVKARTMLDQLQVRYIVVPDHVNEQLMNFEQIAFGELRSYDPPEVTLDANGRLQRKLHYKPEVAETMAYRLAIRPRNPGIPGVELLYGICDDPSRPDEMHGLLFVVDDLPGK
ncbi:MAG: hypothetical protein IPK83_02335 [Planctomycetes bacterium]|nr:hypothetical protein [Planctomycetota bacterium]